MDTVLEFMDSVSKQCITITIIDNLQTENPEESFFVSLERMMGSTLEGVILERNVAEVIVIDNDGKLLLY